MASPWICCLGGGTNANRCTSRLQYSCSGLPSDDPARYLKASEVRRQVQEAPDKRIRLPPGPGSTRSNLAAYPSTFKNTEKLPVQSKTPRQEYPVFSAGSWDPAQPNTMGAARAIYKNSDRATLDVAYHDPNSGGDNRKNFKLAAYRPAKS